MTLLDWPFKSLFIGQFPKILRSALVVPCRCAKLMSFTIFEMNKFLEILSKIMKKNLEYFSKLFRKWDDTFVKLCKCWKKLAKFRENFEEIAKKFYLNFGNNSMRNSQMLPIWRISVMKILRIWKNYF